MRMSIKSVSYLPTISALLLKGNNCLIIVEIEILVWLIRTEVYKFMFLLNNRLLSVWTNTREWTMLTERAFKAFFYDNKKENFFYIVIAVHCHFCLYLSLECVCMKERKVLLEIWLIFKTQAFFLLKPFLLV